MIPGFERKEEFRAGPPDQEGVFIWPDREEFYDVNEIERGGEFWTREVFYGPWKREVRES